MNSIVLNSQNFQREVLESKIPILVDFYTDWCPPCKVLLPIIEELSEKYAGKIKITKLNIGEEEKIALEYGVMSVPTLIIFKDGQEIKRLVGLQTKKELEKNLDSL